MTGDRLIIHGPSFHTELTLSDLRQVRRTRHLILFMVQPGSAVPVPSSGFATPADADAFYAAAFSRWQAARPAPAAKTHLDGKS
ncbi:YcxB family protein [Asticcacaulis biprosthecium]